MRSFSASEKRGAMRMEDPDDGSTLVRTLARVLLAACCHTALQAHALATATGAQAHAWQWSWTGAALAVSFGNDFVAHDGSSSEKINRTRY